MVDKTTVDKDVSWIGARLSEKSTYAGLTVLISLAFPHLTDAAGYANDISLIGMGIGGLVALLLPEKGSAS